MIPLKKSIVFIIAIIQVMFLVSPASAKLILGPYLQSESAGTMMLCAWIESGDKVSFRILTPDGKEIDYQAQGQKPACAKAKDLVPEIEYRYELILNGEKVNRETTSAFLASSQVSQTFVIYGDTRSGDDSFDLAHRDVIQAIREVAVPDAIIHTGDFVESGKDFALWINFFNLERELLRNVPIFPAIGRSDQPPALIKDIFPLLNESGWYSFDRADSHFVILNLWQSRSQPSDETSIEGEQGKWLLTDLMNARNRGQRYIFVIMHQPPFDLTGKLTKAASETYMPLFENFKVNAVFSGAHFFSHSVKNGVHYFTNGGGGALLESQPPNEGVYRFYRAIHHFLVLEIGRIGARVRAVNTQGEDFYVVSFDKGAKSAIDAKAPTYVESYFGGTTSVAMDVYFQYGCDQCKILEEQLPEIAQSTGITLVVTFRSIDSTENAGKLLSLTGHKTVTPVIAVGGEVFEGMDQIETMFAEAIVDEAKSKSQNSMDTVRVLLFIIVPVTGFLLFVSLIYFRKKRR